MIVNKISFLILITCLLCSCSHKSIEPATTIEPKTYTYLALGDSYTIGQGVDEQSRWPNQLSKRLLENDKTISEVNIIAKTGWTTKNLLDAIEVEAPKNHDLVSLLIGVNNQYQGLSFDQFKTEFDALLNIAIDLANGKKRVFVVSIPDYGLTPFGANNSEQIAAELDMYNDYMETQSNNLEIPFINITEISRELGNAEGALATDNLHPSGDQYEKWVEEMLPVVVSLLEE